MELTDNGFLRKNRATRPKPFMVKWATKHSCHANVGTINLPKQYAGKRFILRLEWLDE